MIATHSVSLAGAIAPGAALLVACASLSCSSSASPTRSASSDAGGAPLTTQDAAAPAAEAGGSSAIVETGVMIDYESLSPIPGLTVTDNGVSTTTDAQGAYTLSVPSTATLLAPTVSGPKYSTLLFPSSTPAGTTVDFGRNVIPSSSTYALEQQILGNDQTKALVQVVVKVTGSCTSAVGGALQVVSPAGTSTSYFSTANIPDATLTSFQAVTSPRSVAVIYDIPPGSELTLAVTHPSCTLASFPATIDGEALTGQVTTKATEPGDVNAAIVLVLQ